MVCVRQSRLVAENAYLLLLLSRFSRVRLCATPKTAAHHAPPCLGFSRQEHWSGLPFPSPMHFFLKSESEVAQSYPTPRDPMDCSLPGSSVHGIFQARVLEWGAIAFSDLISRTLKILAAKFCLHKSLFPLIFSSLTHHSLTLHVSTPNPLRRSVASLFPDSHNEGLTSSGSLTP